MACRDVWNAFAPTHLTKSLRWNTSPQKMTPDELMAQLKTGKIKTDEFLDIAKYLPQSELAKLTELLLEWTHRRDK